MKTLILNSANVASNDNSRYTYTLSGTAKFKDDQISIGSVSLYYSWVNISSARGNNTLSYVWYYGATPTSQTINITIDDGFYSVSELNTFLQQKMIANKHYLIDSDGDNVYFLELTTDSSYYSVLFNSYYLLTSAQATALSYSAPSGWQGYVNTNITPQLIIPSTNLRYTLGYNNQTMPSVTQTTNYSKLSDFTPQLSFVQSVLMRCNLVNNKMSNPGDILYTFSPSDVGYGSIIYSSPNFPMWCDITDGNFNEISIEFRDQDFNKLVIKDTNLVIMLLIRNKKENF